MNTRRGRQRLLSEPEVFRIARPNEKTPSVRMADALAGNTDKGTTSLLDIANTYTDPKERRAELKRATRTSNRKWDNGYWLGQTFDETQGLTDQFLEMSERGRIQLYDIVPDEKGYKLMFQRLTEVGDGSKGFGSVKATVNEMSDQVVEYANKAGLGTLQGNVDFVLPVGSDLTKGGQYAQVRAQQATGLKQLLYQAKNGTVTSDVVELAGDRVFDALESRGSALANKLGISSGIEMQQEFLGLLDIAYANRDSLSDRDLGLVFGLEKSGISSSSVFNKMDRGQLGAALGTEGDAFISRLSSSIEGSSGVYGEALTFWRDEASRYPASRPRLERRVIENLVNAPSSSFVSFNNIDERAILLGDIASGLELPEEDFLSAMKQVENTYKNKGGSSVFNIKKTRTSVMEELAMSRTGTGQYVDLEDALGKGKGVFLPSTDMLARLAPAIDTTGYLDPIESEYGRSVQRFIDAGNRWAQTQDNDSLKQLERSVEVIHRQENAMRHAAKRSMFSGRLMHSQLEMTTGQTQLGAGMTEGFGMIAKVSPARAESMFDRAISHFSADQDMVAELMRQKKLVLEEGKVGAMAITRYPATSDKARQLMGFKVDDTIEDLRIHMGRRLEAKSNGDLVELGPWRAMAGSADHDGDQAAFNLIAGKNSKTAFTMVNDLRVLQQLSDNTATQGSRMLAAEAAISSQIDSLTKGGRLSSNFTSSMLSHIGQSEIGMLSYQTNALKYVGFASNKDWGTGARLSDANYKAFSDVLYALEQEGVKFKHGINVTSMLTSDLSRIYETSNLDNAKTALKDTLEKWLGPEIFGEGIKYEVGGETHSLKLSPSFLDEVEPGLAVLRSREGRDAYNLARMKIDKALKTSSHIYEGLIERGKQTGSLFELAQQMSSDVMYGGADEGSSLGEKLISALNMERHRAAAEMKASTAAKFIKPAGAALMVGGLLYSLMDRGYSSTELEAPTPGPEGQPTSSPIAMKMAIANGELLREERGGPGWNRGQNQQMPEPNANIQAPGAPNSIPTKSYIDNNTGRINVRAMLPSNVDSQQFADTLRVSMPHAQVGVNVTHQHVMPRDLSHEL